MAGIRVEMATPREHVGAPYSFVTGWIDLAQVQVAVPIESADGATYLLIFRDGVRLGVKANPQLLDWLDNDLP